MKICSLLLGVFGIVLLNSGNGVYTKEIPKEETGSSRALNLPMQICTALNNCQQQQAGLVIDYHWTGCTDPKACNYVIIILHNSYTVRFIQINNNTTI